MSKEEIRKELWDKGIKCELDKGMINIYLDNYNDKTVKETRKMMKEYPCSYAIKPMPKKKTDDANRIVRTNNYVES